MKLLLHAIPVLLFAVLPLVTSCQTDPLTGKSTLNIYDYQSEKQLGDENVQPILAELGGLYPDRATQEYVNRVGQKVVEAGRTRLKGEAQFPDWEFNFYVVNTSMINAFALPGGHVFVTRGIMQRLKDESELAGLLGHEVTHVFGRHGTERMSEATLVMLGLMLVASTGDEMEGVALIGLVGYQLLSLSYSRDNEKESDTFGMRFAARAGYHPDGIINVMRMLEQVTQEHGGGGPEFLSSHPDPGNRVDYLSRQQKNEYKGDGQYLRNEGEYNNALVDMRAAQPAYDLADRGDALAGEALQSKDAAVRKQKLEQALDLYTQAVNQRSDHAVLHVNVAQALYYLGRYDEAEQSSRKALALDGNGFWPSFMGGAVALRRSDWAVSASRLEHALALVPGSPSGMYLLAQAYDGAGRNADAAAWYRKTYDTFGGEGEIAEACRARLIAMGEPDPAAK
ncbi:MAG: M48 family metalloprotease [Planctomycetes bacterium]|nr:M48 family metalloprotease [Planctomycetota bacterium]